MGNPIEDPSKDPSGPLMAEEKERQKLPPHDASSQDLDRGWAWMVMVASLIVNVLFDGVCSSFGVFYIAYLEHFESGKGKTSWIGAMQSGMLHIMGPVTGVLCNRYGCRPVTVAGAVIAAAGLAISSLVTSLDAFILLNGVVTGVGFGLMYLPSIVAVSYYFEKRRAFATGVAVCGSGLGILTFPLLSEYLISTYGWQGALWILSGIILNGVVAGVIFWPNSRSTSIEDGNNNLENKIIHPVPEEADIQTGNRTDDVEATVIILPITDMTPFTSIHSLEKTTTYKPNGTINLTSDHDGISPEQCKELLQDPGTYTSRTKKTRGMCEAVFSLVDLIQEKTFFLYLVFCFLCSLGLYVPYTFLPDMALTFGASKTDAALLVSIIGIVTTAARIVIGFISDLPWCDSIVMTALAAFIWGLSTALCPLTNSYALLATYAAVFGASIAVTVSQRSIIIIDLLGLQHVAAGFGLVIFTTGCGCILGPPMAGFLFDATGTYDVSFYVTGGILLLATATCVALAVFVTLIRRQKKLVQHVS